MTWRQKDGQIYSLEGKTRRRGREGGNFIWKGRYGEGEGERETDRQRVCLCSTFSGQNQASVTRLVQNTVASFLIFVESPKKRRSRSPIVTSQKGAFTIGYAAKSAILGSI